MLLGQRVDIRRQVFRAADQLQRAGDALKKTRDAAVYLITQRYGRTPARSYFAGGSNGGREAFAVIQRWPQDFDGAITMLMIITDGLWCRRVTQA